MSVYNRELVLNKYKNSKSFKINEDIIENDDTFVVGSIDIVLTTRCNLKCKNCGNLMNLYNSPKDVDYNKIIKTLDRFFSIVDIIPRVNVLGGETFLYKKLDEIIRYLNNKPQVLKVVIATNGLVVPNNPQLYQALKNPKNEVRISHYKTYSDKSCDMVDKLSLENVKCTLKEFGMNEYLWYDFGGFENRHRTENELIKQYEKCDVEWYSLYDGKLYPCPRTAHAVDLGLIDGEDNCVDILDYNLSDLELLNKLKKFIYDTKYFKCCNYCNRGTDKCVVIPVAEQQNKK